MARQWLVPYWPKATKLELLEHFGCRKVLTVQDLSFHFGLTLKGAYSAIRRLKKQGLIEYEMSPIRGMKNWSLTMRGWQKLDYLTHLEEVPSESELERENEELRRRNKVLEEANQALKQKVRYLDMEARGLRKNRDHWKSMARLLAAGLWQTGAR